MRARDDLGHTHTCTHSDTYGDRHIDTSTHAGFKRTSAQAPRRRAVAVAAAVAVAVAVISLSQPQSLSLRP